MVLFSTVTRDAELFVSLSTGMTAGRSARSIVMAQSMLIPYLDPAEQKAGIERLQTVSDDDDDQLAPAGDDAGAVRSRCCGKINGGDLENGGGG